MVFGMAYKVVVIKLLFVLQEIVLRVKISDRVALAFALVVKYRSFDQVPAIGLFVYLKGRHTLPEKMQSIAGKEIRLRFCC